LIEYFLAGDELIAFVLREGIARVYRKLADRSMVEDAIRRLRFQIVRASGPAASMRRGGRRLLDDVTLARSFATCTTCWCDRFVQPWRIVKR
jgi:hypothetical protein